MVDNCKIKRASEILFYIPKTKRTINMLINSFFMNKNYTAQTILTKVKKLLDMKKIKYGIPAIALFIFLSFSSVAQDVEFSKSNFPGKEKEFKEARNNITVGNRYYEMGKGMYITALSNFLKAQSLNPNNAELNYLIGMCYLNTVEKPKSIEYFEKSLLLNPSKFPDIKYQLAKAYQLNYEFDKAIKLFSEYKQVLPPADFANASVDIKKKIQECNDGKLLVSKPARVFIDNLGPVINSKYPDYSPLINADESILFFTSRRNNTTAGNIDENNLEYYEDIYRSEKKSSGWTNPKNPPSPLNGEFHDATVGLSPDGQTLLTYKGTNGGDIFECHEKGDSWSKPDGLNDKINTKYHESAGAISYDGKILYFVSDRPSGFGGRDIYMSKKDKKGRWSDPENLGPVINTPYDEEGVFIHPYGKTLYFSSKGHNTMGGFDIFKTTYNNSVWSEPVNIGYPINTPDDDVFFSISASGIHGYYSSVKHDGYGDQDIYLITFMGEEKPLVNNTEDNLLASVAQPVNETVIEQSVEIKESMGTILKGVVMDAKTSAPLGATIEITDNELNENVASLEANSVSGKYLVTLPSGKNYGIAVKYPGYIFHSENQDIPASTSFREIEKNIQLQKIEVGSSIVLNNIFFDFDKSTLRPASVHELELLLSFLNDFPTVKIEISGHTDSKGTAAYNKPLSQSRAKVVVDYLIDKGINKNRMTYMGYGFDKPIATNETAEGRQLNRRTEFKIIAK